MNTVYSNLNFNEKTVKALNVQNSNSINTLNDKNALFNNKLLPKDKNCLCLV